MKKLLALLFLTTNILAGPGGGGATLPDDMRISPETILKITPKIRVKLKDISDVMKKDGEIVLGNDQDFMKLILRTSNSFKLSDSLIDDIQLKNGTLIKVK